MEMFHNLKTLLNGKPTIVANTEDSTLDYDAGAQILAHYQNEWEQLHMNNEVNADNANKVADIINKLHNDVHTQHQHVSKINQILSASPGIKDSIESCVKQLGQLQESFETVEKELILFEDLIEQCEMERMKNDHRYQLAMYQEKRLAQLEEVRVNLSALHAENVVNHERKENKNLQERQEVFQEAFKSDLETYKNLGTIPKISVKSQPSALLEEIQLDMDEKDLLDFLEEQ